MKSIKCNDYEFNQISSGKQKFKIFIDEEFEFLEKCELVNDNEEKLLIQITAINTYLNIDDVLKVVDINNFGDYSSLDAFKKKMEEYYDLSKKIIVCRLKNLNDNSINIEEPELLKIIELGKIEKITLGLSGCDVYKTSLTTGENVILKVKKITNDNELKDEYEVLNFLYGKVNVAKNIYYNKYNGREYLLRECVDGTPLYKFKNFGYKLGEELKQFHNLYNENITFDKFSTQKLLEHVLDKLDIVYLQRSKKFNSFTKKELKQFLIDNTPSDDALIHGDFSLTNILNNNDVFYYIDLANVSKSTKYFDIYVLYKSFIINDLESEYEKFLEGYGIDNVNENYLDWMSFIELSYS